MQLVSIITVNFNHSYLTKALLDSIVFRHPVLSFQYISHRVLRWKVVPPLIILVFVLNLIFVIQGSGAYYLLLLAGQILFYMAAALGFLLGKAAASK